MCADAATLDTLDLTKAWYRKTVAGKADMY
jgi:hypothetical protein